jgi:S-DNA-T family DNA segregation ATPase FtsK/SpoIIIE
MLVFWGGATLVGRPLARPAIKSAGIVLLTIATATFLAMVVRPGAYLTGGLSGPGGLIGGGLADLLRARTGDVGAFIIAIVGFTVGITLATEWLVFEIARDVGLGALRGARVTGEALAWTGGSVALAAQSLKREKAPAPPKPKEKASRRERLPVLVEEPEPPAPPPKPEPEPPPRKARKKPERKPDEPRPKAAPPRRAPPVRKPAARSSATGQPYVYPPLDLLDPVKSRDPRHQEALIQENGEILEETLREFKVEAEVVDYRRGPVVTLYELDLAAGVKVNRIHSLSEDLAVALKAPSVRVVAPLPGKSTIGVEVPNPARDDVRLRTLITSEAFERNPGYLPLFVGADVAGNSLLEDLTTMPHVLIAGATGSGKSICINAFLLSLLMTRTPEQVRLILIDPKQVELAFFSKVPHLMSPVITDAKKAMTVLEWIVDQMEERYALFHATEVRNIGSYNELGPKRIKQRKEELGISDEDESNGQGFPDLLPYIVVVVDELADLMMVAGKEIETLITRLAQKSRAVGIHIVLATQRPSTDVITGLIKANMPTRCSFQVASKIDSRVVLDQNGAEKLLGRGDMLYLPPRTSHLVRAQGTFVSDGEVKRVVAFLADRLEQEFNSSLAEAQTGELVRDEDKDPLYDEAVRVILSEQRGSASLLQRALGVGYTRGSRLMDIMHKEGIVGPYKGSKAREVLMDLDEYEELTRARREAT